MLRCLPEAAGGGRYTSRPALWLAEFNQASTTQVRSVTGDCLERIDSIDNFVALLCHQFIEKYDSSLSK